jgi:FMN phosphatase YigB (HAD superfamily)
MDFDWIFFDCFNTLIDDFVDESGLCSIPRKAVEWGLFSSEEAFRETYLASMRQLGPDWTEVTLAERLRFCVEDAMSRGCSAPVGALDEMMVCWERDYPKILRPTPGVREMLAHWRGRVQLGVVSNFFMPGWPARYLDWHGLGK